MASLRLVEVSAPGILEKTGFKISWSVRWLNSAHIFMGSTTSLEILYCKASTSFQGADSLVRKAVWDAGKPW